MNFDVTSFGEAMLRLSVPAGQRIDRATTFDVHLGGAESNVLAALATLKRRCGWVSRVPDSPLGEFVLWTLRVAGVDVSEVVVAPATRQAIFFVELGTPPRPTDVVYDRQDSAAAELSVHAMPWPYLLSTRLLHLTGITPALSRSCRDLCEVALQRACVADVPVCFDVNYRAKLWPATDAGAWILKYVRNLEIFICGRADAASLFGLSGSDDDVLEALIERFAATTTVLTLGSAGALAAVAGERIHADPVPAAMMDRLGAGDAFAAGVIDGWLDGDLSKGLKRGSGLASLALAQHGDMLATSRDELDRLLQSAAGATHVRR